MDRTGGAVEAGVAEGEDAAVGGEEPVALAVGGGGHPDDRLVQVDRPGGAVERGVAEGEDAAVGGHQPVALARTGGGDADDRPVEGHGCRGAENRCVAQGEDAPGGGGQPVVGGDGTVGRTGLVLRGDGRRLRRAEEDGQGGGGEQKCERAEERLPDRHVTGIVTEGGDLEVTVGGNRGRRSRSAPEKEKGAGDTVRR